MRGQVFRVAINEHGPKPWVVVSNNVRNRKLDSVLAVRITTTNRSYVPTAVQMSKDDPVVGFALADDIQELFEDEVERAERLGALCPKTLVALNSALKEALGIP